MKERGNNKGFSLVELIIVIAIMAILSAALAPQLMKYIEKSRQSTDKTTCNSIESCVNTVLTNETVWNEIAKTAATRDVWTVYVRKDEASGTLFFDGALRGGNFRKELEPLMGTLENPKQTGRSCYRIDIYVAKDTTNGTFSVSKVEVSTDDHVISHDTAFGTAGP